MSESIGKKVNMVELRGVGKTYREGAMETVALRAIDLVVTKGEFLCLSGPSGSGKTTLLHLIGCLETPSEGEIRIAGTRLAPLSRRAAARLRREHVGFIFQSHNLIPVLTALENVEYPLDLAGVPAAERRERAMKALENVGLAGLEGKRPGNMSGGQQQRVAVARAIVTRPAIVLADEPTASLDSNTGADLVELLHRLNGEEGMTFIFSSHDPQMVAQAGRVIRLRDGRVGGDTVSTTLPPRTAIV